MKSKKISPDKFEKYIETIGLIYQSLENQIFIEIVERLKVSEEESKHLAALTWQVIALSQMKAFNRDMVELLVKTNDNAAKEMKKLIKDVGSNTIRTVDKELGIIYDPIRFPDNFESIADEHLQVVYKEFNRHVNTTLIDTHYGPGTASNMYRKIIKETTGKVLAGNTTINKAIVETVSRWIEKGVDTGFVDRGGRTWSLDSYARTAIRTTVNKIYNDLRISRMAEYGVDLVLVSSLPDPREACSHIQGKVASIKEPYLNDSKYPSIYEFGYGEPWGLRGINCRHQFFPYVDGLNTNNQIQYSEEEMTENRKDRQKQRYHERQIRDAKKKLRVAETAEEKESILRYRKLLRNRQAAMRGFINKSGRTRQYDREKVF